MSYWARTPRGCVVGSSGIWRRIAMIPPSERAPFHPILLPACRRSNASRKSSLVGWRRHAIGKAADAEQLPRDRARWESAAAAASQDTSEASVSKSSASTGQIGSFDARMQLRWPAFMPRPFDSCPRATSKLQRRLAQLMAPEVDQRPSVWRLFRGRCSFTPVTSGSPSAVIPIREGVSAAMVSRREAEGLRSRCGNQLLRAGWLRTNGRSAQHVGRSLPAMGLASEGTKAVARQRGSRWLCEKRRGLRRPAALTATG